MLKSSARIVQSVVLHRPDETAPVSNLYLWKRKEDLVFEQEVGKDSCRRHHVRFWESTKQIGGRSLWLGATTFDTKVGARHRTGMITHHIDANIDADRNKLMKEAVSNLNRNCWEEFARRKPQRESENRGTRGGGC